MHNEILDPKSQKRGDFKEAFNIGEFTEEGKARQGMPEWMEEREGELFEFEMLCRKTCDRILDLLALGLEVEGEDREKFFSKRHTKPSGSTTRLLYYPAVEGDYDEEAGDVRAGAHSDYGSCTLLFQKMGQPGLEIRTEDDKGWAPVEVCPEGYERGRREGVPPILVNIGDLMSYWSNGMLKSTVHRVIFPKGETRGRYSIVYFCHPGNEEKLVALPSKAVEGFRLEEGKEVGYGGGAAKEKAMTAREHLDNRLRATYDFREEVKA